MEHISLPPWRPVGYCFLVWNNSAMLQFCPWANKKEWMFLSAALILATAMASSCGDEQGGGTSLRAADVPVHALLHSSEDPAAAFPELFPMQIAVYWTNPNEGVLGVVHALRAMGIPFFVTRDFSRALLHRLIIIYPNSDSTTFAAGQIEELMRHMRSGGSIFAVNVVARSLGALF